MWNELGITIGGLLLGVAGWKGAYHMGVYSARKELENSVKVLEDDNKEKHKELIDKMYNLLKEMEEDRKTKIF